MAAGIEASVARAIALFQVVEDAHRHRLYLIGSREGQRVNEISPGEQKGEQPRCDYSWHDQRQDDPDKRSPLTGPIHLCRLRQFVGHRKQEGAQD